MGAETLFSARNLVLRYSAGTGRGRGGIASADLPAPAFAVDALEIRPGERIALTGPNGSGKTTLLKALNGLIRPWSGDLDFLGEAAWRSAGLRSRSVYLHQHAYIFAGTIAYNVGFACRARGIARPATATRVRECLDLLGLAGFAHRRHAALSGGEAQRVALARALAGGADILLLDEPTASADAASADLIAAALRAAADSGATIVFGTHDESLAESLATRRIELFRGGLSRDRSVRHGG